MDRKYLRGETNYSPTNGRICRKVRMRTTEPKYFARVCKQGASFPFNLDRFILGYRNQSPEFGIFSQIANSYHSKSSFSFSVTVWPITLD
jgi:hypothetical protein